MLQQNWHRLLTLAVAFLLWLTVQNSAFAAETAYLTLTANGVEIPGEAAPSNLVQADAIEILSYTQTSNAPFDPGAGRLTGRQTYGPITFTKPIDRASPLIAKAFTNNEEIEAIFRFFQPSSEGDLRNFYSITVSNGRIVGIQQVQPNTVNRNTMALPEFEEIQLAFTTITWTHEDTNIEHTVSVREAV